MMGTVRFSKIVEAAGKPIVHLLWVDPAKDPVLKKAVNANRVMTVHQQVTDAKADYGTVGFQKGVSGQILIFPKSIKGFADKRVTGVKYDLLEWPKVPKSQQVPKVIPAKRPAKSKPQDTEVHETAERSVAEESAAATVVKFPNPGKDDANGSTADAEEIKNQVRLAMKVLEEGRQVAAFNLLKRIVDT
jgi:hypothetical protein